MQDWSSAADSVQVTPPFFPALSMTLFLSWSPVPSRLAQESVQLDHASHVPHEQSTKENFELQYRGALNISSQVMSSR